MFASHPSTLVAAAQFITTSGFTSLKTVLTCSKLVMSNLSTSTAKTSAVLITSETVPISDVIKTAEK